MAYYDALIVKWPTLTPGTTDQKLAEINALQVLFSKPAILDVTAIINAILPADFIALTALQLQQMTLLLGGSGSVNASPGTTIRSVFATLFSGKVTTLANLTALVTPFDNATEYWTTVNGYGRIGHDDLTAAGGLT